MDVRPGRSLGLLSVAHAVNHAFAVLLPLIFLAIIDEFGVTVQSVAFLAAAGSMASGLVQLSYAELTRRVSRRRLLGLGGILFGGGFAAMSLATNFVTFAIPNIAARIGGSPQHPVGNGLLAEQYPPERRGFAISAHIAGGNVGTVVVAVIGTPLIALIGWRGVSVVFGVAAIAIALGILAARPRTRHGPGSCPGRWQQHRRASAGRGRPRPALGVPDIGPRRRRPRARRREPVRADLPDPRDRPR